MAERREKYKRNHPEESDDDSVYDAYYVPEKNPKLLLDLESSNSTDENKELFYEWGADKAAFGSSELFETFCAKAGIDPVGDYKPLQEYQPNKVSGHSWTSRDKKLTFKGSCDPRDPDSSYNMGDGTQIGGVVHYFGLTGVRSRAKPLERWFHDNANWEEMCYGGRGFC